MAIKTRLGQSAEIDPAKLFQVDSARKRRFLT